MTATQCREHRWLAKKSSAQQVEQTLRTAKQEIPVRNRAIQRVQTSNADELDVTKDNLRLFVERWREHPDSPYLIDTPQCTLPQQSSSRDHEEFVSMRGHSPSPCASICSAQSETTDNSSSNSRSLFLTVPSLGFGLERRASEGVAREKPRSDHASQIVLAEEIIKLSEHLRSIAMGTSLKSNEDGAPTEGGKETAKKLEDKSKNNRNGVRGSRSNGLVCENTECNEITEKLSNIMRQRKLNGTTFHSSRSFDRGAEAGAGNMFASLKKKRQRREDEKKEAEWASKNSVTSEGIEEAVECSTGDKNARISGWTEAEMDLTPPWRRPRVKQFGETSRDVPRISGLCNVHKSLNLDEPTSTKDLLLHLLGEWEEVASRQSSVGRKSVSVDWGGEESVARKTMNSLAEYFQSKQQKSTATNVDSTTSSSIHR